MMFIIIFLFAIGTWETYVYNTHRYPEDLCLTVACYGAAAFLLAAMINKVELLP